MHLLRKIKKINKKQKKGIQKNDKNIRNLMKRFRNTVKTMTRFPAGQQLLFMSSSGHSVKCAKRVRTCPYTNHQKTKMSPKSPWCWLCSGKMALLRCAQSCLPGEEGPGWWRCKSGSVGWSSGQLLWQGLQWA